jgi:SAM-dependent methyltransferase
MKDKRRRSMAQRADRHVLYQRSVQCVEAEVDFVDSTYRTLRGRFGTVLREDFCGTASTACEWVKRRRSNLAFGVDIDPDVLAWGSQHNVDKLGAHAKRVSLICDDVMTARTPMPPNVVLAMNFSYWVFKSRLALRRYFRVTRESLQDEGILFLDAYGGHDAFKVTKDRHKYPGYTYIWDQARYNPISGEMVAHIHFAFPDGSKLQRAFTYEWRLWTLPEIRELLDEAGFSRSTVYWQGTEEETGEGDGDFKPATVGDPDPAWIAYIVAEK